MRDRVTPPADLHIELDAPLPAELIACEHTAVFVAGWCATAMRPGSLRLVVDGQRVAVAAQQMPRMDVQRALGHGYRSGFWVLAPLRPRADTACEVVLEGEHEDGRPARAALASIPVRPPPEPARVGAPEAHGGPLVAVCMASFDAPRELLVRQIASIRAQTHRNWVCLISDDHSDPRRFAELEALVGDDPRFVVDRSPQRLGFYRNFERALALAPAAADFVALADQDDTWYPDKLATLLGAIGDARLVYSDARIIARDGTPLADSYWGARRNNHTDLLSLLVANAVTGAASLLRRDLLDDALPFPPAQFTHFHDHWLGLTALTLGDIAYVDRPLYDYVQHGDASLGHAAANRVTVLRDRLGRLRGDPRERIRMWRMHYFVDVARIAQFAMVLELRCGARSTAAKRRDLAVFARGGRSAAAVARLWARGAREVSGRRTETLGAEWTLAHALVWRRALGLTARDNPAARLRLEAVPPTILAPGPRQTLPAGPARAVAEKIAPLALAVRDGAPERVNVLIPTIDLEHFFGGYIAKFNLARRLAERGLRVRIVTVDPVPPLPQAWRARIESYEGLGGLFDRVEVAFGREAAGLEVSRRDRFVASTWWTAHIAASAAGALGGGRFLYLIQEYEPFTFPMGTHAALAAESYTFAHTALFSTELLRGWFRREGLGVYAAGADAGDRDSVAFENAITAVDPPAAEDLAARNTRRLLFYARPEPHAARNMFDMGVLALGRALQQGAFAGWELRGIGTLAAGRRIDLGGGSSLTLLPRADQRAYAELLREHDVGLALMYTPHPSLVPIEMASAGMLTVTNSFANKTPASLTEISPNLIAAEPSIGAIADALTAAAAAADDAGRRAAGAQVRWSRDWDRSFDDGVLDRIVALLDPVR